MAISRLPLEIISVGGMGKVSSMNFLSVLDNRKDTRLCLWVHPVAILKEPHGALGPLRGELHFLCL